MSILELDGVTVAYGSVIALRDVSLVVPEGGIVCILGANGAGKSTLLKAVAGLVPLAGGRIRHNGEDISGMPAYEAVTRGIMLCPEGRRLFPLMSVLDNLRMGAYRLRSRAELARRLDRVFALFPRLGERRQQIAGSLSGGEQQMAAIGRALMAAPRLLMFDEPSLGLAPRIIAEVARIVGEINRAGITVVLVEQNARLALRLSEYGYVLESGRIALKGDSRTLLDDPYVKAIYLGETTADDPPRPTTEEQG
jgi:branched-chain amino acid transport system ATP-binding protein